MMHKAKSGNKIDLAVAAAMAVGRASEDERLSLVEQPWFTPDMLNPI